MDIVNRPRQANRFLITICLLSLGAFALRLWNLGTQSLWHDEAWSIFSAYHPLMLGSPQIDPNTPPVFYISLSAWMRLVGDGIWVLRFWSAVIGVIVVPLIAAILRRWYGNRVAVYGAFMAAIVPIFWTYSQEIRAYITVPLYALALLVLADRLLRKPDRLAWFSMLAVELLALYTHNLAVALVAWLDIIVLCIWVFRQDRRRVLMWLAAQAGVVLVYLPWVLTQHQTGTQLNIPPAITPGVLWSIWQSYFVGVNTLLNVDTAMAILVAGYGIFALIAWLAACLRRRDVRLLLIASQAVLVTAFELAIIWLAHIDFHPRYFIAGVPCTIALLAIGIDAFTSRQDTATATSQKNANPHGTMQRKWTRFGGTAWLTIAALIPVIISARALTLVESNPIYQHDDFRAVAQHYATLSSDDVVIVPYGWEPTLAYYADKLAIRAQIIHVPLGSTWQSIAETLNYLLPHHIEVLTWYQLPADLRGVYPCLLGAASGSEPSTYTVIGLSTTSYDRPAPIVPKLLSTAPVSFGLFNLTATHLVSGSRQACVMSDWTLADRNEMTIQDSFHVSAGLQNAMGWTFAQTDADLRDNRQVPTQFWTVGHRGTAFLPIQYPFGLPQGKYALVTGIYSAHSLRGLDVIRDGAPVGQETSPGYLDAHPDEHNNASLAAYSFVTVTKSLSVAIAHGAGSTVCQLQAGQEYRVTTLWNAAPGTTPTATLRLEGNDWRLSQAMPEISNGGYRLAWYAFRIPASANGRAALAAIASDGSMHVMQQCEITASNHLYSAPPIAHPLNLSFGDIGTLAGFDLASATLKQNEPFTLTVYWRADGTAAIAYTVFTHLLDANGRVIAQDDAPPAAGTRPTTAWLKGEYVVDSHVLTFNAQGQGYTGAATLEVGLYDAGSGARVPASNGADHVLLPVTVTVR